MGDVTRIAAAGGAEPKRSALERLADRILLLEGWRRALVAFLAGALAVLGLAPFNLPLVGFVSFPLLVWLLDGAAGDPHRGALGRLGPAFFTGWFFGFGYFVAGLWWLAAAVLVGGDAFLWALPFAVFGLPALLAIYFGLAAILARLLWSDGPLRIFALAFAFALAEFGRARLLTGFPWNEIGGMAAPVPLAMQSLAFVGVHGLTLGALVIFAAPAVLADRRGQWPVLCIAGLLLAAHLGTGAWRLSGASDDDVQGLTLRVVQPNIQQSTKWDEAAAEANFQRLLDLTRAPSPEIGRMLVIWPETAFPFLLTERPDAVEKLAETLQPGQTLVAGAVRIEDLPNNDYLAYNSVYVIDETGEIRDARDKLHLVPFGEYLPFQDLLESWGVNQLTNMPGGFSAGAARRPVAIDGAPSFLPLICYEIIFPEEITAGEGADGASFIVNVTNDAWYGNTPGPYQHLRQSQMTAVALGLPLVRSANTGISVVTDAFGRLRDGLALGSTGTIDIPLPVAAPPTAYARWRDLPFLAGLALAALAALGGRLRELARIY